MDILVEPIAFVRNSRRDPSDDFWGGVISEIELAAEIPEEAFSEIGLFSHLEIIYFFDRTDVAKLDFARRPRGNAAWPLMGIFAHISKRPYCQLCLPLVVMLVDV